MDEPTFTKVAEMYLIYLRDHINRDFISSKKRKDPRISITLKPLPFVIAKKIFSSFLPLEEEEQLSPDTIIQIDEPERLGKLFGEGWEKQVFFFNGKPDATLEVTPTSVRLIFLTNELGIEYFTLKFTVRCVNRHDTFQWGI